jgi:hypothetical protein
MNDATNLILVLSTVSALASVITLLTVISVSNRCKHLAIARGGIDDQRQRISNLQRGIDDQKGGIDDQKGGIDDQ